jgi:hypothetical protein
MDATSILPPSQAVEIAWGLSNQFSEDCRAQLQAEKARTHLERVIESPKGEGADEEKRYVAGTQGLIDGALRTLHIIVAGRDLNIKDLDQLREKKQENIEAFARLSGNLQSMGSRGMTTLFAGTVGGVGLAEALSRWTAIKEIDVAVIQGLAILAAGALGYGIHEFIIAPVVRRVLTRELIKKDYDRTLYFDQYYQRCRWALESLYEQVEDWHKKVFGARHAPETNAKEVVSHVLQGGQSTFCPWVHKHVKKGWIKGWIEPDLWSLCETGGTRLKLVEKHCPVFDKREKRRWP